MNQIAKELALAALEIGAIKIRPHSPFVWTTGYQMPIYNDNRLLMGSLKHRKLVATGFREALKSYTKNGDTEKFDIVAGVATAGISHATTLANELALPLIYIRDKPKEHGIGKQVEGIYTPGQKAIVIEDLISTGKSSAAAVIALRDTGVICNLCLSIFNYEFSTATEHFKEINTQVISLLKFSELLTIMKESNKLSNDDYDMLSTWSNNPFEWGEKHGFPRVKK